MRRAALHASFIFAPPLPPFRAFCAMKWAEKVFYPYFCSHKQY